MTDPIQFQLNGKPVSVRKGQGRTLLWTLRTDFELTGTKYGCGEGHCGSCTVLVNGEAIRSCQYPLASVQDKNVMTIEGLARGETLHPLQKAFIEHHALQCGFCTPGMILNAHALLRKHPRPTEAQVREGMENNLCRCGAHNRIIRAVLDAADKNA